MWKSTFPISLEELEGQVTTSDGTGTLKFTPSLPLPPGSLTLRWRDIYHLSLHLCCCLPYAWPAWLIYVTCLTPVSNKICNLVFGSKFLSGHC